MKHQGFKDTIEGCSTPTQQAPVKSSRTELKPRARTQKRGRGGREQVKWEMKVEKVNEMNEVNEATETGSGVCVAPQKQLPFVIS